MTALLHLLQPLARLTGRLRSGLTFWRYNASGFAMPWPRKFAVWTEHWRDPNERLKSFEADLRKAGVYVRRGGDYDRWDLEVRAGLLGCARLLMAVEDHGAGNQFVRVRLWPQCSLLELLPIVLFASLSAAAALDHAWVASAIMGLLSLFLTLYSLRGCGSAVAAILRTFQHSDGIHDEQKKYSSLELYRRLFLEIRPYRLHIGAILLVTLLSPPLALLIPLPLKNRRR